MSYIFFLVNLFENKECADDFIRGKLFINRLSYFKKFEGDDGRGDEYEGAMMLPITEGLVVTLESTDESTGETHQFTIPVEDFAAPPIIAPRWFNHLNVFCMYAVLVANYQEFLKRVGIAVERNGYWCTGRLVSYYDPNVGSPPTQMDIDTIFTKRDTFEEQREFRIAVNTGAVGCKPITLDIGDISDIASYVETADISSQVSVEFRQTSSFTSSRPKDHLPLPRPLHNNPLQRLRAPTARLVPVALLPALPLPPFAFRFCHHQSPRENIFQCSRICSTLYQGDIRTLE